MSSNSSEQFSHLSCPTTPPSQTSQTRDDRLEEARKLSRERKVAIQALSSSLPAGGLYVLLSYRQEPPALNDFHWALYLHRGQGCGTKYHISNLMTGHWMADHAVTTNTGIFNSNFLVVVICISIIPQDWFATFDLEARALDQDLNISSMTCRVWALQVLARFRNAGLITFDDSLDDLQAELLTIGNFHRFSASANEQPRPLVTATRCH